MVLPRKKPTVVADYTSSLSDRLDAAVLSAEKEPPQVVAASIAKLVRAAEDMKRILAGRPPS